MVFGVAFQVFGQLPDPAREERDLHIGAARVLPMQLELLDVQRFRILSHFEARILDQVGGIARPRRGITQLARRVVCAVKNGTRNL
jgi:hypothetical protein